MNNYSICWMHICPFEINKERKFKALRDEYPYRFCVFDKKSKKVIDVKTEMEYDYIYISSIYFILEEAKKIVAGQRYAIRELQISMFDASIDDINHAKSIIERLKNGEVFLKGNNYNNTEYLNIINSENNKKVKSKKRG